MLTLMYVFYIIIYTHCRSTPTETLHTLLLGPYKYLLRSFMSKLSPGEKEKISAQILSFDFSGFKMKLSSKVCRHFRSFVGRDFKLLAQIALFIFGPYLSPDEVEVWLALSKVW